MSIISFYIIIIISYIKNKLKLSLQFKKKKIHLLFWVCTKMQSVYAEDIILYTILIIQQARKQAKYKIGTFKLSTF